MHLRARPCDSGEETDRDVDASIDLRRAIAALPRRQQEAVVLHYLADLPVDQVATVMRCENGTVKAHLWKARQLMAQRMEEADEDA